MRTQSAQIDTTMNTVTTPRMTSIAAAIIRLLWRSTMAPACNENTSHGIDAAVARPPTSRGSRVSEAASNGNAVNEAPSPKAETVDAVHRRQYAAPSGLARAFTVQSRLKAEQFEQPWVAHGELATVDNQRVAVYECGFIARQKQGGVGDVERLT